MAQVIDVLPYVDKQPNDDIKKEIDKMIKSELKKINKKNIDKEINEKYKNKDEEIKNPLDAESFLDSNHIFNKFTICQMNTSTTDIYITNKIK